MNDQQIGDYKILKQIGAGGMARVYLGVHKDVPNLKVVLKVLSDPRQAERFKQEADKLALLDRHPHICKIKHFFNHGEELVIVMEYIEGETLKEILDEKEILTIPEALQIICDIISALEPAHQQGIYHRDIKPGNIMFKESGQVKIIDFGIAKAKTDPSLTMVGTTAGTPDYMAPEQFAASDDLDYARSDIYAVGTMLYRMLTGELPFKGENEFLLRDAKMLETPAKPSELNGEISRELDEIILKSISSDPEKRYGSVAEMKDKLKEIQQSYKTAETVVSIREPERREPPGAKKGAGGARKIISIAAVIIILAAVAVYFLLIRPSPSTMGEITVTVTPASNIYIDGELAGRGTSVHSARLEEGKHILKIENMSALFEKELVDTVMISAGRRLIREYSFMGGLDIRVNPAGTIFVGDAMVEESTSGKLLPLPPGRHIVRVRNEEASGVKEFKDTIQLAANRRVEREYTFKIPSPDENRDGRREESDRQEAREEKAEPAIAPGMLLVGSRPRFGDIYIDGVLQNYKTPYTFSLPPGEYSIRVVIVEDGKSYQQNYRVEIKSGETEKINFKPLE
ncbi:MAG: protein kinase [Candidatus Latescibacteria bacterium]|nr:protein kinase [bacterium]MBD3424117.1 protein kinase [Candidatus Latescibacterota bacterium]